jgi:hypothetical protein
MADEIAQDPRPECTGSATPPARAAIPRPVARDPARHRALAKPRPPNTRSKASGGQSRPAIRFPAFDDRQQMVVHPSGIKPGDWLGDLGTLRHVESVDAVSLRTGPGMIHILHFEAQPGVASTALCFSNAAEEVTVWRTA